jgi:D-cysteine desulfhydrase
MSELPRLPLVHGPTPLVKRPALDAWLGVDLWIKRDDATGGAEAGNKLRKLEWLLADARARRADVIVTCGGIQSNHARSTALVCAALGLGCVLVLRASQTEGAERALRGNFALDRLAGAQIRLISPAEYAQRAAVMESVAIELRDLGKRPYVIPEGGSNGLGALGYVECMREVRRQLDLHLAGSSAPFHAVVHACGSGGTAAGVSLGASQFAVAETVRAIAVCDDAAYFERVVAGIVHEARSWDSSLGSPAPLTIDEDSRGPAYAVASAEQRASIVRAARAGVVLDPVYTGKALHGLWAAIERGAIPRGARVLFLHTGGLPGLLAQADDFAPELV